MEARFQISERDYVDAMKLHGKLTTKMVIICLVVMGALVLVAIFGTPLLRSGAIGGLIGGSLVAIFGRYLITPIVAKRHYRNYKAIHDEFAISLQDNGVYLESTNAKGVLPWTDILKWREDETFLLLYLMPRMFHIVPKSLAEQGFNINLLVKNLNENVGKSA